MSIPAGAEAKNVPADHNSGRVPLTSFIGREGELAQVTALLKGDVRLVTLVGPGGVGKTRLAGRVAEEARDSFRDGVHYVDLQTIADPDLLISLVAREVGVEEAGDRPLIDRLVNVLQEQRTLLVIDNFEHVVEAALHLAQLLSACPLLTVLVTSRVALNITGEHVFPVLPLAVPASLEGQAVIAARESDAVRLFESRARTVKPDFVLNAQNAAAVAEICRRLDGLPLAIELAAARIAHLPLAALLERLERRLPLLTGGPRDLPERQRTMADAIAWSYDLLAPHDQEIFQRLAVFIGGFDLDAVEALSEESGGSRIDALDRVGSLVAQSLVRQVETPDGQARYSMLETVREFGIDQLNRAGDTERVRAAHAHWFLEEARQAAGKIHGPASEAILAHLGRNLGNLRAALSWFESSADADSLLEMAGSLHWFWHMHGHYFEGRQWLNAALAATGSTPSQQRSVALCGIGILAFQQGDYPAARDDFRQAIEESRSMGDAATLAYALLFKESAALYHGYPVGDESLEESISIYRVLGDAWGLSSALCARGILAIEQEDSAADAYLTESLEVARAVGDTWALARSIHYAGELARWKGDDERARALYEESLGLYEALGHRVGIAFMRHNLAYIALHAGDVREAARGFADAMATFSEFREHRLGRHIGHCLTGLGRVMFRLGNPKQAARLIGASEAILERTGIEVWTVDRAEYERGLAELAGVPDPGAIAAARLAGREAPLDTIMTEAQAVLPGIPEPELTSHFGLTGRELEVLRLLAEGKSDPLIAEALFVSRRTAATHVANILRKLDVPSRSAAAALAVRHNLA